MVHLNSGDPSSADVADIIASCRASHDRLLGTIEPLTDEATGRPSELPGWTVGHVLTHIARNAESHIRMLEGALRGATVEQYAGGYEERAADIEAGANRPAVVLVDDVRTTARALEQTWERMTPQAWKGNGLARGRPWPCRDLPLHRWREVEIHHVDLGLGYGYDEWPEDYVRHELPAALATLPGRLPDPTAHHRLLAWLLGRSWEPGTLDIEGWQSDPDYYFTRGG